MINTVKGEEIMKKLLIALMAISLIFGLASCKSTKQEDASETPVEQPQEPTDETVEDTTDESTDETDSFAEKNAKLMEQLSGSRDGAIKAGADKYYADQLSALDEQLKSLKDKVAEVLLTEHSHDGAPIALGSSSELFRSDWCSPCCSLHLISEIWVSASMLIPSIC